MLTTLIRIKHTTSKVGKCWRIDGYGWKWIYGVVMFSFVFSRKWNVYESCVVGHMFIHTVSLHTVLRFILKKNNAPPYKVSHQGIAEQKVKNN